MLFLPSPSSSPSQKISLLYPIQGLLAIQSHLFKKWSRHSRRRSRSPRLWYRRWQPTPPSSTHETRRVHRVRYDCRLRSLRRCSCSRWRGGRGAERRRQLSTMWGRRSISRSVMSPDGRESHFSTTLFASFFSAWELKSLLISSRRCLPIHSHIPRESYRPAFLCASSQLQPDSS